MFVTLNTLDHSEQERYLEAASQHPLVENVLEYLQSVLIVTKSWIDRSWTFGDFPGQLDLNWAQSVRRPPGNISRQMESEVP